MQKSKLESESKSFAALRGQYKTFHYHGCHLSQGDGCVVLRFDFAIDGLCDFHPETVILTDNLRICNAIDTPTAQKIAFSLGLAELISYWKCACPPQVVIHCGTLTKQEQNWWKRLWFHGLGEFFYRNQIETAQNDFLRLDVREAACCAPPKAFECADLRLVPVGGGKDSCVTLDLLRQTGKPLMGFTVNDQPARAETFAAAGFAPEQMLRARRKIDPTLLLRNREGFLNGHTPFSAIVAFLGLFAAYLVGADEIVLSNEASANESSVLGTDINHQYSKSFAFERDFHAYVRKSIGVPIRYFSLLRPFHELQIAKQFAALPQFHRAFKSCNVGSKQNIWCGKCAKCLFVALILAPFLPPDALAAIFGKDMFDDPDLLSEFRALLGQSQAKPFECVGTVNEAAAALGLTIARYESQSLPLPRLLAACRAFALPPHAAARLLGDFNPENLIPPMLQSQIERMFSFVRGSA
ncbi:MAG: hypothetical protein LBB67_02260 [Oscillospiraceae bacterium]|jgi:hypothetical protein|nr:hypothetical protein [Oscillospiraceae bacterium]